ncbi:hypothetical protein ACUJ46_11900 [Sandaracinobacteroides sp. A072]|uniref:hypothetical protein n=1 Tax=Sandaracinobacteroides sp. A072 TaxID=3461146 RepID=UPI004041B0A4
MAILAASIESNGSILAVDGDWPASAFADFMLDPDGSPRVVLTATGPGHERQGVEAVAAPGRVRQFPAIRMLRVPAGAPVEGGPVPDFVETGEDKGKPILPLDETELGNGLRRVRMMLHQPVAAGEAVSLAFAPGWRAGEPGAALVAVNLSQLVHEKPAARWARMPFERVTDNRVRLDLLVAHWAPEGQSAVAGVRFSVTDGVAIRTAWAVIGTSTLYGDALRCWTAEVDLTGLSPGLVSAHWSVFPWVGAVRHSSGAADPALSPQHSATVAVAARAATAEKPLAIAHDPGGQRYGYTTQASHAPAPSTYFPYVCVAVDPAGTATASNRTAAEGLAGFGNTPEEARTAALAVANRPANLVTATNVLRYLGRALPAANGQAAIAVGAIDGWEIFLPAGTHQIPGGNAVVGTSATECPVVLKGAGADATTLVSAASSSGIRAAMVQFRDMRLLGGQVSLPGTTVRLVGPDVDVSAKPGYEASAGSYWSAAAAAEEVNHWQVKSRWWKSGTTLGGSSMVVELARSVEHARGIATNVAANCARIADPSLPQPSDPTHAVTTYPAGTTSVESVADRFIWGCDGRGVHPVTGWAFSIPQRIGADGRLKALRFVCVNSLFEKIGAGTAPAYVLGEGNTTPLDVSGLVIEGCTFLGDRANSLYNDPNPPDLAATFTMDNSYGHCRVANSYYDRIAIKQDCFDNPVVNALRGGGAGNGRRRHLTRGWVALMGQLHEGMVDGQRFGDGGLNGQVMEYYGPGAATNPNDGKDPVPDMGWPAFGDDRSYYGTNSGWGDYRPQPGSPLMARGLRAQIDVDMAGQPRLAPFAAGALEGEAPMVAVLTPDSARHLSADSGAGPGWSGVVAGASGRLATGGAPPVLTAVPPEAEEPPGKGNEPGPGAGRRITVRAGPRTLPAGAN